MSEDSAVRLSVNGAEVTLDLDPQTPLLIALRNDLKLKGARSGCGIGECGACTVIIDGRPVRSCITPLSAAAGAHVISPEGLGTPEEPHPLQTAFLEEQAAQCGYCINGIIMSVTAALEDPAADRETIDAALTGHLCRCGTHARILRAIRRAAPRGAAPGHGASVTAPTPAARAQAPTDEDGPETQSHASLPPGVRAAPDVADWLQLLPTGRVLARTGKVEIGQGIRTALSQIVAAQLGTAADRVEVTSASTDDSPDEGHTASSASIEEGGASIAMAAVAFRRLLAIRAAGLLSTSAEGLLLTAEGVVGRDGERLSFPELLAAGPITGLIQPGDRPSWTHGPLGQSIHRPDLLMKVTGAPAYLHDLHPEGMLHSRALLPPGYHARLDRVDTEAARAVAGVQAIIHEQRLLIAIAEREEQAMRAVARLRASAVWDDPGLQFSGRDPIATLRSLPGKPYVARQDADVEAILSGGKRLKSSYASAYQAHGAMASSCAVATYDGERLTVWTHSQGIYPLRREIAALLDEDEDRLVVKHVDGPGCYGQNGADDAAGLAAVAARAVPGRPVRFQFSIEDEFAWEPYGSAMAMDLEAAMDDSGRLTAWRHRTRTDVHSSRPTGDGDRLIAAWLRRQDAPLPWPGPMESGGRNIVPLYAIPAVDAVADHVRGPLRTGALRSLGAYGNVFAAESFIDELAEAAGQDPVAFRLAQLADGRARAVLEAAAETAGWDPHVGPSGRGQGIALARYKNSKAYVAEVVDADIDSDTGEIRVNRVVIACDAGKVVNPDGLRNQLEGGALQGLSRALYEEVSADSRGVGSRDWTAYPVLRFAQVPRLDVAVIDRPAHRPLGVGEAATPPLPAALANAVDDASGIRLRTLPLTSERSRQRLMDMSEEEAARVLIA